MSDLKRRAGEAIRQNERIWIPPDDRSDLQPIHYDQGMPSQSTVESLLRDGWRPGTEAEMRLRMRRWRGDGPMNHA